VTLYSLDNLFPIKAQRETADFAIDLVWSFKSIQETRLEIFKLLDVRAALHNQESLKRLIAVDIELHFQVLFDGRRNDACQPDLLPRLL